MTSTYYLLSFTVLLILFLRELFNKLVTAIQEGSSDPEQFVHKLRRVVGDILNEEENRSKKLGMCLLVRLSEPPVRVRLCECVDA